MPSSTKHTWNIYHTWLKLLLQYTTSQNSFMFMDYTNRPNLTSSSRIWICIIVTYSIMSNTVVVGLLLSFSPVCVCLSLLCSRTPAGPSSELRPLIISCRLWLAERVQFIKGRDIIGSRLVQTTLLVLQISVCFVHLGCLAIWGIWLVVLFIVLTQDKSFFFILFMKC